MGSLNDKLDATVSSKEAIKNAINSKGGIISESTPLSQYDDIINSFEILDSAMKQDIDTLINSSAVYRTKLRTAVDNLTKYLNVLNSYINPNYTSGGDYLIPKVNNLKNETYTQITNMRNKIIELGGGSPAFSLYAINEALNNLNLSGSSSVSLYEAEITHGTQEVYESRIKISELNFTNLNNFVIFIKKTPYNMNGTPVIASIYKMSGQSVRGVSYSETNFYNLDSSNIILKDKYIDIESSGNPGSFYFKGSNYGGYYCITWD